MKRFAILLLPVLLAACSPAEITEPSDELVHFLSKQDHPGQVRCDNTEIEGKWYVGCYDEDDLLKAVSVFHVIEKASGTEIYAVNSRARQFAKDQYRPDDDQSNLRAVIDKIHGR